jgi:hypothetical protein
MKTYKAYMQDFQSTWGLAFMSGFLAAKGLDDSGPDTPAKRMAEEQGLAAMRAQPFWGPGNADAYLEAKASLCGTGQLELELASWWEQQSGVPGLEN